MLKLLVLLMLVSFASLGQGGKSEADSLANEGEKFLLVEKHAEFPGGMGKFYRYIMENLRYPPDAKRNGIEGKVYVEFVIHQDGSIEDTTVRALGSDDLQKINLPKGIIFNSDCQDEAVRLLKECPDWNPALIKNRPVRQKMVVPIIFKI